MSTETDNEHRKSLMKEIIPIELIRAVPKEVEIRDGKVLDNGAVSKPKAIFTLITGKRISVAETNPRLKNLEGQLVFFIVSTNSFTNPQGETVYYTTGEIIGKSKVKEVLGLE